MAEYAVWAPTAKKVHMTVDHARRLLFMNHRNGWWFTEAEATAQTRYAFVVDDSDPMPDPRSCSQPDGPHGSSQVVIHNSFKWSDDKWRGIDLQKSVIYELHVGTFTSQGTFESAIEKLDHLVELGIDAIELMPVVEFAGDRGWGYDGVNLYAPHHAYGGPAGLKKLVDACHQRGLGVIFDVVYNHLGPDGNYLDQFGPYFTDKHQTPWGPGVNYDQEDSKTVREYVLENVEMWFECYHADGLRLDAIHAIIDDSPKHIVEEISEFVHRIGHHRGFPAWCTIESDLNNPQFVRPKAKAGWGVDAQWDDDFHHALHALMTGETSGYYVDYGDIEQLAKAIREGYVFTGQKSKFLGRKRGAPADGVEPGRFIVFSQNHDQVGNRAEGERLSMLVDRRLLDVAAAVVLLGPSVPLLFQGEEWGAQTPFLFFTDHHEELGHAVTEGRKKEFGHEDVPDPQDLSSFEKSKLDWAELNKPESQRLFEWYKALIRLRKEHPDFTSATREVRTDGMLLIMDRGGHRIYANFGNDARRYEDVNIKPYSVHIVAE